MILVFPFDYAEAVLDGHAGHGADILSSTRAADPLDINELRLFFLYPEWPSGRWAGMRARRESGHQPMRMKDSKNNRVESVFSDGSEYVETMPKTIRDEHGKVTMIQRFPMTRITPKDRHPGRTRRYDSWCAKNVSTGVEEFEDFSAS